MIFLQKKFNMDPTFHQAFTAHNQPNLLVASFQPTKQQLQFAKQSIIQKHKVANGIQQLLFCKKRNQQDIISLGQKNLLQSERKKYVDYIKKNYSEKISEELLSLGKLKTRIRELESKSKQQRIRERQILEGKNQAEQELGRKRRKQVAQKNTKGSKKVKKDVQDKEDDTKVKTKKGKATQKGKQKSKIPQMQELPSPKIRQIDQQIESLSPDLLNDMSNNDDFMQGQDDE